ncbi:hypothetical protein DID74_01320 [Candidatus Marinamargulisbacteria bacterium SCGC AG-333-B06]|nr:hypothetical protein DID74_01320 [Candidatus Marinamargulisbacteria bacterium SCGC AG-333-B06]
MNPLQAKSYGKLNLSLNVFKQCIKTNLHPIESHFQLISLHDTITITPTTQKKNLYTITYSGIPIPTDSNNIIGRIITTLGPELNYSYTIHINKTIPLGSGMGGASSNAAICLKAINTFEKKEWSYQKLIEISKLFGSDIPFFLKGGSQKVSGFGDILTPKSPIKNSFYTIIYPRIECSTKAIYNHFDTMIKQHEKKIKNACNNLLPVVLNYHQDMSTIYNHLSKETKHPIQLTGSGSTFFIKFKSKEASIKLKNTLQKRFPNFYIQAIEAIYDEHPLTLR